MDEQQEREILVTTNHNLPAPLTSFVGRRIDIENVRRLLESNRLVTLVGPGGTGKTRLALEIARRLVPRYGDGVTLVGLAPLDTPDLLEDTVAKALGVKEQPGEPLSVTLQRFLQHKDCLLLLDNFEHLLSGAQPVADWLAQAPQLRVLVTSREPLNLYGEQRYPVHPLETSAPEKSVLAPALQLFIERARAVRHDLVLNEQSIQAIGEICTLLNGLPLAIELAAARIRLFSPRALRLRLSGAHNAQQATSTLGLLSDGPRDHPARHHTVEATIDWSYHLLNAREQQLFRRLAVFAGGCGLKAVEAVCLLQPLPIADLLETLTSLVDKSLLFTSQAPDGEPRFWMLLVIREYAARRLERLGELEEMRERHAHYYIALAEESKTKFRTPQEAPWLDLLEVDHDNFRAALGWALQYADAVVGLRLCSALWWFWFIRHYVREGRQWIDALLLLDDPTATRWRAAVCHGLGELTFQTRDFVASSAAYEESVQLRRQIGDQKGLAHSLVMFGVVLLESGDYEGADRLLGESLALARALEDEPRAAFALIGLGMSALYQGNLSSAQSLFHEALGLMRRLGDHLGVSSALNNLGVVALYEKAYRRAERLFSLSVEACLPLQAQHYRHTNEMGRALALLRQGRLAPATSLLVEALQVFLEMQDRLRVAQCFEGLAEIREARRRPASAVTLWAAAAAMREELNAPLPPIERQDCERALARLEQKVGRDAFAQSWNQGRQLVLEDFDALTTLALDQEAATEPPSTDEHISLTPRETEVLRLVAQGLTDAQVAETLVISPRTVNAHLSSVYRKLDVTSRTAATLVAQERGLL